MRLRVAAIVAAVVLVLALTAGTATAQGPRLVLFEGFVSIGCTHCGLAAQAMEQLVQDYGAAGSPVIILEQNVEPRTDPRQARFMAAYTGSDPIYFPWTIVDGGHQVSNGTIGDDTVAGYASEYKRLIDAELARSPRVEVQAYSARVGDAVHVSVQVTNLATALSTANGATVWALVYEEVAPVAGANLTSRYVRGLASQAIAGPLATGATATYTLDVTPTANRQITGSPWQDSMDWSKLHVVAFVDYRPGGSTGAYDIAQAAQTEIGSMTLTPDVVHFSVGSAGATWQGNVTLTGPAQLVCSLASQQPWLTVSPTTVTLPAQVQVSVDLTGMPTGGYDGQLLVTATGDGAPLTDEVAVSGTYGAYSVYVPVVLR